MSIERINTPVAKGIILPTLILFGFFFRSLTTSAPFLSDLPLTEYSFALHSRFFFFSYYFTAFLGFATLTWASWSIISSGRIFPPLNRIIFVFSASLFLPLFLSHVLFSIKLPSIYIRLAFLIMLLNLCLGFWSVRAPLRAKFGIAIILLPALLISYWRLSDTYSFLALQNVNFPRLAEHILVVTPFALFLFFVPTERGRAVFSLWPFTIATAITAAFTVFIANDYTTANQLVYHFLHLNLPPISYHGSFYLGALFFFLLTSVHLWLQGGQKRELVYGFFFMVLTGGYVDTPLQYLLCLIAFTVMIRASIPITHGSSNEIYYSGEETGKIWQPILQRIEDAMKHHGLQPTLASIPKGSHYLTRISGLLSNSTPFQLLLDFKGKKLKNFSVQIGDPSLQDEAPDFLLTRQAESKGRKRHRISNGKQFPPKGPFLYSESTNETLSQDFLYALDQETLLTHIHGKLELWQMGTLRYQRYPRYFMDPKKEIRQNEINELLTLIDFLATLPQKYTSKKN